MFPESKDRLGRGGELQVFIDSETHPHATASFAKFTLGVGGALPVYLQYKTEKSAYFLSGEGVAVFLDETGTESVIPVATGYIWYNPPGQWHAVRNTGSTPLSLVFATVPNEKKGLMSFFRRIGSTPVSEGTPISFEELQRSGTRHGPPEPGRRVTRDGQEDRRASLVSNNEGDPAGKGRVLSCVW